MSIIELKDYKQVRDIVHEYPASLKNNQIPVVIDNGSYQCRVGWATSKIPLLTFRNIIAKPEKRRIKKDGVEFAVTSCPQVGNDIVNGESKIIVKTQFDRNVVTHYHNQEQIFDYIFSHLGIDNEGSVPHPIVMTECLANPNYCRSLMSELLFECYDIPSVCYGVDALYSFQRNKIGPNGLIISLGYHTVHIIPVMNNIMIANKARRINIGGYHMLNFLQKLLQLKYPFHVNSITINRIEDLLHKHCSIAVDYIENLKNWSFLDYYEQNVKKIQLPYSMPVNQGVLTPEQKLERKRELVRRFTELNVKRREERLAEDEDQLQRMKNIMELFYNNKNTAFQKALKQNDFANREELEKLMEQINTRIEKTKQKLLAPEPCVVVVEEKPSNSVQQPPTDMTINEWVADVKSKRSQILDRKKIRQQRRQDLAKRRTAASQERMRIISQLARKEKGSDTFGMNDEDWDIYKVISKDHGDSDSEAENEKLIEYDDILRHYDPAFEEPVLPGIGLAEYHQLHVGVEAIRAPELLFQPSMIGSSEAGIAETMLYIFKMFTPEEQMLLATNVFLTGSCAQFPGLEERLSKELYEMRPFQTPHKIYKAKSPSLDAWYGQRDFAMSEHLVNALITKADYLEKGSEYLKEHSASNYFFPTPAPIIEESQTVLTSAAMKTPVTVPPSVTTDVKMET